MPQQGQVEEERRRVQTRQQTTRDGRVKYKAEFLISEDPKKSRFLHGKLVAIEQLSCLLTVLIFFLSVCKTELDSLTGDLMRDNSQYIMGTLSVCTFALMAVLLLRYVCLFEL